MKKKALGIGFVLELPKLIFWLVKPIIELVMWIML